MELEDAILGVAKRPARTQRHQDPAIQSALDIVNQALNPVKVVTPKEIVDIYAQRGIAKREPQIERDVIGLRAPWAQGQEHDPHLYINGASKQYQKAAKGSDLQQLLLAASLVHEQTHETERGDVGERAARAIESSFLESKLGTVGPNDQVKLKELIAQLNALAAPPKVPR